jgi:hypothetical protein
MTLESKLHAAAAANPTLAATLGSSPFRWYDKQLSPGSAFPAVSVLRVSTLPFDTQQGQLTIEAVRLQINAWSTDPEQARLVCDQVMTFLQTFDAVGNGAYANYKISRRGAMFTQSQPAIHMEILEVRLFNRTDH